MGCRGLPAEGFEAYSFEPREGEPVAAELGALHVPENRAKPDSRKIALRFVRFPSTSAEPGSPIVYLAGGPGGSGIQAARGTRFPLFMALREYGDVIALDQRGTGMTGFEELDCDDPFQVPLDAPVDRVAATRIIAEETLDCLRRKRRRGIEVDAYNTRESVADLMALRQFLGAEKLTLWGISYGTHLALATMKEHGDQIDRVILAGLEGLHHTWKLPSNQQALLEEIARLVAEDGDVGPLMPDLLGSIAALLEELRREPKSIQLVHPLKGQAIEVVVGAFDLQAILSGMLRGPSSFSSLPDLVWRLEQGDWTALALASGRRRTGEGFHSMSVAMDCASGASHQWRDRIAREAERTLLGDAINFPYPEICQGLGIPDLGDEFREPVISDVPALLISGTLDGRTPVANGEEVMAGLANAHHLIIDGAGHSDPLFLSTPEILDAMKAFLGDGSVPFDRLEIPGPEFVMPRRPVELTDAQLERFVGTYEIEEDDERVVTKAGPLLFTRRTRGAIFPIRATSETEFFYEESPTHLEFEIDEAGDVAGMVIYHEGADEGEPARKVE